MFFFCLNDTNIDSHWLLWKYISIAVKNTFHFMKTAFPTIMININNRMTVGLANAPTTFQHLMQHCFTEKKFSFCDFFGMTLSYIQNPRNTSNDLTNSLLFYNSRINMCLGFTGYYRRLIAIFLSTFVRNV